METSLESGTMPTPTFLSFGKQELSMESSSSPEETPAPGDGSWWTASIHNVFIDPAFEDKTALPK